MYPLYKEIVQPTSVTHSIEGRFTALKGHDLVVIRHSILTLYNISKENNEDKVKLIQQYPLSGKVESIGTIRIPQNPNHCEYLLLSFKDAKLSILEFNINLNKWITVSIHYYEREELKSHFINNPNPTRLRVDPNHRCLALNFYDTKLAILPMKRKEELFMEDELNSQQPYLPSFIINLNEAEEKVKSVLDICFLHGYFSPTIAVLYEATINYPGNPYKVDSVNLMILSLDISHQTYPIIYRIEKLPSDALRLISLPKPCSGALIICSSGIIYINQGSSTISLSINRFSSRVSDFKYSIKKNFQTSMEMSQQVFLSPTELLFSLKDGGLYFLKLILEGKILIQMELERAGTSIIPSTMCLVGLNAFFIGSQVEDSLLIAFKRSNDGNGLLITNNDNNLNFNSNNDNEHDKAILADIDDLYNETKKVETFEQQLTIQSNDYHYQVIDNFINIGPMTNAIMGSSEYLWDYMDDEVPPILPNHNDLVALSGYQKSGAITVFHHHLRPKVLTSFTMSKGNYLWTLAPRKKANFQDGQQHQSKFHDFIVLAKKEKTLILSTGDELKEVENSGFYTGGNTIYCGILPSLEIMIQIYKTGLRLLDKDGKQFYAKTLASNRQPDQWIQWAMVDEPYILLKRTNQKFNLLKLQFKPTLEVIILETLSFLNNNTITCGYIYKDNYGAFTYPNEMNNLKTRFQNKVPEDIIIDPLEGIEMDEDLYGEVQPELPKSINLPKLEEIQKEIKTKQLLFLIHNGGELEIYDLFNFKLCFRGIGCGLFPWLIYDEKTLELLNYPIKKEENNEKIFEMGVYAFGTNNNPSTYLLFSNENGEVIGYEVIPNLNEENLNLDLNRLSIRLNKLNFNNISFGSFNYNESTNLGKRNQRSDDSSSNEINYQPNYSRFTPFYNVGHHQGVFITGEQPMLLLLTSKHELKLHKLGFEGKIISFAPFHHPNSLLGFAYLTLNNHLKLAQLPPYYNFDLELPVRKVTFGRTLSKLAYHQPSRTYAVISSEQLPYTKLPATEMNQNQNNQTNNPNGFQQEPEPPQFYTTIPPPFPPLMGLFKLELISPITWETVDTYTFDEYEHITSLISVEMDTQYQGKKTFLAISTCFSQGEEVVVKGRIYLFDVIEVVPEINNPRSNHKFKCIVKEDIRGAVTMLAGVNGHLVSCVGSKVIIRSLKEGDTLDGIAFIDVQIYVCSIVTIKNFIILADAYKSVWFLGFQEEPPMLKLLGKDFSNLTCQSLQLLIHGKDLSFLVSDLIGNTFLLSYAPHDIQSFHGQKLIYQADIHLNRLVNNWLMLPCSSNFKKGKSKKDLSSSRHFGLGVTLEGSIVLMMPTNELSHRRLHLLQNCLVTNLQHLAGLNPRSYRLITSSHKFKANPLKGILDGDLLIFYKELPINVQLSIANYLGSSKAVFLNDFQRFFEQELNLF